MPDKEQEKLQKQERQIATLSIAVERWERAQGRYTPTVTEGDLLGALKSMSVSELAYFKEILDKSPKNAQSSINGIIRLADAGNTNWRLDPGVTPAEQKQMVAQRLGRE